MMAWIAYLALTVLMALTLVMAQRTAKISEMSKAFWRSNKNKKNRKNENDEERAESESESQEPRVESRQPRARKALGQLDASPVKIAEVPPSPSSTYT